MQSWRELTAVVSANVVCSVGQCPYLGWIRTLCYRVYLHQQASWHIKALFARIGSELHSRQCVQILMDAIREMVRLNDGAPRDIAAEGEASDVMLAELLDGR